MMPLAVKEGAQGFSDAKLWLFCRKNRVFHFLNFLFVAGYVFTLYKKRAFTGVGGVWPTLACKSPLGWISGQDFQVLLLLWCLILDHFASTYDIDTLGQTLK